MKGVFNKKYKHFEAEINQIINTFDTSGNSIKDARNKIKIFDLRDFKINIKSFKVPNLVNKVVYSFFRKGKAQRSFDYANKLLSLGIGTPEPIAYFELKSFLLLKQSFYVSKHLEYDLTFRELSNDFNYPDHENILRAFTRFTYKLHKNGINFLDHSPGNTLIKKENNDYVFYLVDLNRMKFEDMPFKKGIANFARLTKHKELVDVMSDEYAKCLKKNPEEVFKLMWQYTNEFRIKIRRKIRWKTRLKQ